MKEAFYLTRGGRPSPVLVEFSLDVQKAELDFDIDSHVPMEISAVASDIDKIREAAQMVKASKAPVIITGGGRFTSHCMDGAAKLTKMLQAPAVTIYRVRGGTPEDHPLNAGHAGIQVGQPIGNKVSPDSDLVVGIGDRFSDCYTGDLATCCEDHKFIHTNIEPSQISMVFEPELGIVFDAKLIAETLIVEVKAADVQPINPARTIGISKLREELARKTDYDCSPIMPHRVSQEMNETFDDETYYTVECGITQIWNGQLQRISRAGEYLPPSDAGTFGYGVPTAFGVKVVHLECNNVAVVGNFGLTFMGEETAVVSTFKKPIIAVVVNSAYLGLIRQNQEGYGFEYAVKMPYSRDGTIDYAKLGETYGCVVERTFSPEELAAALVRARASTEASRRCYLTDAICVKTQLCDMGGSTAAVESWAPEA